MMIQIDGMIGNTDTLDRYEYDDTDDTDDTDTGLE
jgi:hypothetical protein